jgi:nanoRNase/pAp phosphatase (c-di-AMP/oligoRNAs hydrolase)
MTSIKESEIILLLKSDDWKIKWSLRSKGKYDCTKIANLFKWGWHKNASWFAIEIESDFETTKTEVIKKLINIYHY